MAQSTIHAKAAVLLCLLALLTGCAQPGQPASDPFELSNGLLHAVLLRPNATTGAYRASRFDWSGHVIEVRLGDHRFFGPRTTAGAADPLAPDGSQGTVEEFGIEKAHGFDQAAPGHSFVKIGVGKLIRPDNRDYFFNRPYAFADRPQWRLRIQPREAEFEQTLQDDALGYHYLKRITLAPNQPELTIHRQLKNTGSQPIHTQHYGHNFVIINARAPGPGYRLAWPEGTALIGDPNTEWAAAIRQNTVTFTRSLRSGEAHFMNFKPTAADHTAKVTVSNAAGGTVEITQSARPAALKLYVNQWAICPELFTDIHLSPGQEMSWNTHYLFKTDNAESVRP